MARATYEELLTTVSLDHCAWNQPGFTGQATELFPTVTDETDGDPQAYWSSYRNRFIAIMDNAQFIAYGESADGLTWPKMQTILGSKAQKAVPAYANAVGLGLDPAILGKTFYTFYTDWPSGESWFPAEIKRLTITTDDCGEIRER